MIRAIVFDLDDTLYAEYEYVLDGFRAVSKVFEEKYGIINAYTKLVNLYQEDSKNVYNRLLDKEHISYNNNDIKLLADIYRNNKPQSLTPYDGAISALNWLKDNGYLLGIITDGREYQQNSKLDALNIRKYFDEIIISDSLGGEEFRKPDKRVYILMAQKLNVNIDEMIYVGDNPNKDFYISKELPVKTIRIKTNGIYKDAVNREGIAPHYIVNDYSELTECIVKLSKA